MAGYKPKTSGHLQTTSPQIAFFLLRFSLGVSAAKSVADPPRDRPSLKHSRNFPCIPNDLHPCALPVPKPI